LWLLLFLGWDRTHACHCALYEFIHLLDCSGAEGTRKDSVLELPVETRERVLAIVAQHIVDAHYLPEEEDRHEIRQACKPRDYQVKSNVDFDVTLEFNSLSLPRAFKH